MELERRHFIAGSAAVAALGGTAIAQSAEQPMFGLIGRMRAKPGQRTALIAQLMEGVSNMPGCLSYIIAEDMEDADGIWVTEVWDREESHEASLSLPAVRAAITRARPLIAEIGAGNVTRPIGGHGLK